MILPAKFEPFLCEFYNSQKNENPDDNNHIDRLTIIYNYSNAPSLTHAVYSMGPTHFAGRPMLAHFYMLGNCLSQLKMIW